MRTKSNEKRIKILNATVEIIASKGIASTPTSAIAKLSGIAEGTIFSYFSNKDELLNATYIYLKESLHAQLRDNYQDDMTFQQRFSILWNNYINWGIMNPMANQAMTQLSVSTILTEQTQKQANESFPDLAVAEQFSKSAIFKGQADFSEAIFTAIADQTIVFALKTPEAADQLKQMGFNAIWKICGEE